MKTKFAIALVINAYVAMPVVAADIYRWTDPETGKIVTTPSLPPYPIKEKRTAGGLPGGELVNVILDTNAPEVKSIIERRKAKEEEAKHIAEENQKQQAMKAAKEEQEYQSALEKWKKRAEVERQQAEVERQQNDEKEKELIAKNLEEIYKNVGKPLTLQSVWYEQRGEHKGVIYICFDRPLNQSKNDKNYGVSYVVHTKDNWQEKSGEGRYRVKEVMSFNSLYENGKEIKRCQYLLSQDPYLKHSANRNLFHINRLRMDNISFIEVELYKDGKIIEKKIFDHFELN